MFQSLLNCEEGNCNQASKPVLMEDTTKKRVFSPPVVLLLLVFSLLLMLPEASATKFTVGDNRFWNPNINYTDWARGKHFYLGDWLCEYPFSIYLCMCFVYEWTFVSVIGVAAASLWTGSGLVGGCDELVKAVIFLLFSLLNLVSFEPRGYIW